MLHDIFSNRDEKIPDVFQYNRLPEQLRGQLVHIAEDLYTLDTKFSDPNATKFAYLALTRELGRQFLQDNNSGRHLDGPGMNTDIKRFLYLNTSVNDILSLFELYFRGTAANLVKQPSWEREKLIDKLIALQKETNQRFLRAGIGYQYAGSQFIRIDSTHVHKEIILPALSILTAPAFAGANGEYRLAHEHYRKQEFTPCLNECLKAFESMMKSICDKKGWTYQPGDAASKLVQVMQTNGLFPAYLGTSLTYLTGMLTSTVPTIRNKQSGHGTGTTPTQVKEEYAAFSLQSTAANIILLSKLEKQIPDRP